MVSDGVHSRFLTVCIYLLVFLFVMRSALFVMFLWNPISSGSKTTGLFNPLATTQSSAMASELGYPLNLIITGYYERAETAKGIANITVYAGLQLTDAETNIWQVRYGFEDTMYDYTGVPMLGAYTYPGFAPRVFNNPILSGNVTHTNIVGSYDFRMLRMQLGIPGTYRISLRTPVSAATADGGQVTFTTTVAQIAILSADVARKRTVVELGQPLLTPFVVRVMDAKGRPLIGKRVALISAPRSLQEASSFLSRPDMVYPRFALVENGISTVTDYAGRAAFQNVTITASTLSTVRLDFVCDGIRDPDAWVEFTVVAPRAPAASPAPLPGSMQDLRRIVMRIIQQPSSQVVEGTTLPIQPVVQVFNNVSTPAGWVLSPLVGARIIALPFKQAGLRTDTLTSPQWAAELGAVYGSTSSILANLGQQKLLANFTSEPSDELGTARWAHLGFTRHGPIGAYTITFAFAGIHKEVETSDIDVMTSVSTVMHVAAVGNATGATAYAWRQSSPAYNVTICNYPACKYYIGGSYGSPAYADVLRTENFTIPNGDQLAPVAPSGSLENPPVLRVVDSSGRILAGKVAIPRVYRNITQANGGWQLILADDVVIEEYPFRGASTTLLSIASDAQLASDDGVLPFLRSNIAAGQQAQLTIATSTGRYGSFFRVVAAPAGTVNNLLLAFSVDGIETTPAPIIVTNLDQAPDPASSPIQQCAFIKVLKQPTRIQQSGSSLVTKDSSIIGDDFTVQAFDSFGSPLRLPTIQQHLTDFIGIAAIAPHEWTYSMGVSPRYLTYLLRMGGPMAFALGNFSAIQLHQLLMPSLLDNATDDDGIMTSTVTGIQTMYNTYVRYAFAAVEPFNEWDTTTVDWFPRSACYSTSTIPIPVTGTIAGIEWLQPPASSDNITCIADGVTPLSPAPQPIVYYQDGTIAEGLESTGILVTQFDDQLISYPAHEGVNAREFTAQAIFQDPLGFPSIRLPGDPSASVMLPPDGDRVLFGNINPLASIPFGSLSHTLLVQSNASLPPQPMDPTSTLGFVDFRDDIIPGKLIGALPPVALRTGSPGTLNFVAYSQGIVSEPWTPAICTDNVSAILVSDYASGAAAAAAFTSNLSAFIWTQNCPTDIGIYYNGPETSYDPTRIMTLPIPTCPNACSGHGFCVCGVCVCKAPYDGSPDCSQPYSDDNWNIIFSGDPLYAYMYGGMPVLDVRAAMESAATPGYLYEIVPRFLLAGTVAVGKYSNSTKLAQYVSALVGSNAAAFGDSLRLSDSLAAALNGGAVPGVTFERSPHGGHNVFAILITCDGTPVEQQYTTPVTPLLDRCSENNYPLSSNNGFAAAGGQLLPPGLSSFDTYLPIWTTNNYTDPLADLVEPYADRRFMLQNVPTGCYRFKYVYGFDSPGSFLHHSMPSADAIQSGNAVSLGASRPFRVISPVVSIDFAQWPSLFVPFDTAFPVPPIIKLSVRASSSQLDQPLLDTCQMNLASAVGTMDSPVLSRCPLNPYGGFPVYISAISYETGEELPLFQDVLNNDCARAGNMTLINASTSSGPFTAPVIYQQYLAEFSSLIFPSRMQRPSTGVGASKRAEIRPLLAKPGAYYLKATAYGTSVVSEFTITVTSNADMINWSLPPDASASAGIGLPAGAVAAGISATLGVPVLLPSPLQIQAVIDSTRGIVPPTELQASSGGRYIPAPNVPVSLTIVDAPPDANVQLADGSASAVTDVNGIATFRSFTFISGKSGRYVILATSPGVTCNRTVHAIVVNLTNPIQSIDLVVGGYENFQNLAPGSAAGTSYLNPIVIDIAQPRSISMSACLRTNGAPLPAGSTIMMTTLLDRPDGDVPGTTQPTVSAWEADANATTCAGWYPLPMTPSSTVATSQNGVINSVDSHGCISTPNFYVTGLSSSTRIALVLQSQGVMSRPIHLAILTPADAHPFRFSDLQSEIPIPFALALGPLLANQVYLGILTRLLAVLLAAAMATLFWILGTAKFTEQLYDIFQFYESQDGTYILVIQVAYIMSLVIVSVAIAVSLVLTVLTVLRHYGCAACCRARKAIMTSRHGRGPASVAPAAQRPLLAQALLSFDTYKHELFMAYAASRRPRVCAPLLNDTNGWLLSAELIEALSQIFQRYSATSFAETASILVGDRDSEVKQRWWVREALLPGSTNALRLSDEITHAAGGLVFVRRSTRRATDAANSRFACAAQCTRWARAATACSATSKAVLLLHKALSAEGMASLQRHLLQSNVGMDAQSLDERVDFNTFLHVMEHRVNTFSPVNFVASLRGMFHSPSSDAANPPYMLFEEDYHLWFEKASARLSPRGMRVIRQQERAAELRWRFTARGTMLLQEIYGLIVNYLLHEATARDPALAGAPAFLAVLDAPFARMWNRLFASPNHAAYYRKPMQAMPTLLDFLSAYHERILDVHYQSRVKLSKPGKLLRVNELIDDCSVWNELHSWDFDHSLRHSIFNDSGQLTSSVYRILAACFAHVSDSDKPPQPLLSWEELMKARESLGFPPARRDYFDAVARSQLDGRMKRAERTITRGVARESTILTPTFCAVVADIERNDSAAITNNPLAQVANTVLNERASFSFKGNAMQEPAPVDEARIGPRGYAVLSTYLYQDAESHIRQLIRRLGYTDRLLWSGARCAERSGTPQADQFVDSAAVVEYTKAIAQVEKQHSGKSAHPLAHLSKLAASASMFKLESPIFMPQRILVAMALSLVMILLLAVLAFSLTTQLSVLFDKAANELVYLRSMLLQTVSDAGDIGFSVGNQYLQGILNGAAGFALAGPAAFFTQSITPQSVNAFINGKVASVMEDASVSTSGVAGIAISAAATAAEVSLDTYISTALGAASNIAGQLPSAVDTLPATAADMIQQRLGIQLSESGLESFALKTANNLLAQYLPGSLPFVNSIIAMSSPDFWTELAAKLSRAVEHANVTAVVLGCTLVLVSWALMLSKYRQGVVLARVGVYPFLYKSTSVSSASRYIGIQATLSALTFFLAYITVFLIYLTVSIPGLMKYLWNIGLNFALGLLGITLFVRVLEYILVSYVFAFRDTIKFRRLYMLADLWLSFLGMVVGVVAAIARLAAVIPFALLALMRADLSPVPLEYESYDSAKATYNSMMLQDTQFSHPLKYAFCIFLLETLYKRRHTQNPTYRTSIRTVNQIDGDTSVDNAARTLSNTLAKQRHHISVNPLKHTTPGATSPQDISLVRASAVSTWAAGTPDLAVESIRRRVRNRWHLAVLLAFNPSLRAYRVRDLPSTATTSTLFGGGKSKQWRTLATAQDRERAFDGTAVSILEPGLIN